MNTNCKRLLHVTFAIGVLVLAMSASTPTEASAVRAQKIEPVAVRGTGISFPQASPTVRSRAGEYSSWIVNRRGLLAMILRCVTLAPVQSVVPEGVVVDDGVPF